MKKIGIILSIIATGLLIWYLFIKPYDYLVTFKSNTSSGTINQSIKLWGESLNNASVIEQQNMHNLKQQLTFNDSIHTYVWDIIAVNDSTSKVKVYIRDNDNSLMNKITIPFSHTDFEKRTRRTIFNFHEKLNDHVKNFRVTIEGLQELKSTYCAYVPVEAKQYGKAFGMMRNYSLLSNHIAENWVELNGKPFIEITRWDREKDSVYYNFCYPIIKSDSLPIHKLIKYKQFEGKKALKAIYNGNYLTSDRAWYALIDYAKKKKIEIEYLPVEIFYNNPNLGGNELSWKAEIFMPIK